jgi:hypothetical protein
MNKLFTVLLIAFVSLPAKAISPEEVVKNLHAAATVTVQQYKQGGISALVEGSKQCYMDINKYRFYCIYLDLAARHVSERDGAGVRFPPEKYFVDDQFLLRAGEIFLRSSMNMDQSNQYLAMVTPLINKLVDQELAVKEVKQ